MSFCLPFWNLMRYIAVLREKDIEGENKRDQFIILLDFPM